MKKSSVLLFTFPLSIFFLVVGCSAIQSAPPLSPGSVSPATSPSPSQQQTLPDSLQKQTSPNWNIADMNAIKNGNISIAVNALKSAGDIKLNATAPDPISVFKAPWNYYGKIVKITGYIGIVQDYPPGSDTAKLLGGSAGEMVLTSDDGTFTDFLISGSSGSAKIGDTVTIYGYPAGQADAPNKLGGTTTELVIVGNAFDITQ